MKAGQARQRLLDLLKRTGRFGDAAYLEYIGRDNQKVIKALDQLPDEPGPYFSLFVVLPNGARSE
jgi:precorrin-2/cobalt-factor-2 C20-methyltransferase